MGEPAFPESFRETWLDLIAIVFAAPARGAGSPPEFLRGADAFAAEILLARELVARVEAGTRDLTGGLREHPAYRVLGLGSTPPYTRLPDPWRAHVARFYLGGTTYPAQFGSVPKDRAPPGAYAAELASVVSEAGTLIPAVVAAWGSVPFLAARAPFANHVSASSAIGVTGSTLYPLDPEDAGYSAAVAAYDAAHVTWVAALTVLHTTLHGE